MWICYKREQINYLSATGIIAICYQVLYIEISNEYFKLILSIIYIGFVWIIIKAYSDKINKEHNEKLLNEILAENAKFEALQKYRKSK